MPQGVQAAAFSSDGTRFAVGERRWPLGTLFNIYGLLCIVLSLSIDMLLNISAGQPKERVCLQLLAAIRYEKVRHCIASSTLSCASVSLFLKAYSYKTN